MRKHYDEENKLNDKWKIVNAIIMDNEKDFSRHILKSSIIESDKVRYEDTIECFEKTGTNPITAMSSIFDMYITVSISASLKSSECGLDEKTLYSWIDNSIDNCSYISVMEELNKLCNGALNDGNYKEQMMLLSSAIFTIFMTSILLGNYFKDSSDEYSNYSMVRDMLFNKFNKIDEEPALRFIVIISLNSYTALNIINMHDSRYSKVIDYIKVSEWNDNYDESLGSIVSSSEFCKYIENELELVNGAANIEEDYDDDGTFDRLIKESIHGILLCAIVGIIKLEKEGKVEKISSTNEKYVDLYEKMKKVMEGYD